MKPLSPLKLRRACHQQALRVSKILDDQAAAIVQRSAHAQRPVVVDKLRWRRSMCGEEFAYLRARTTKATKVTLISAQQAAAYYDPEKSKSAYPTRDAYLADVVVVERRSKEI